MKIKKGDKVKIISGKARGRESTVSVVLPRKGRIVVEGVNIVKRHVKPSARYKEGGIVEITKPIDVSSVMLVCPKCQQATRIGYKVGGNKKFRICKKCGGTL